MLTYADVCCTYADVCCTYAEQERQGVKLLQTEMPVTDKTLQALAPPLFHLLTKPLPSAN